MTVMNFFQIVYNMVQRIPAGKVATYGQIALLTGSPRAARQVGYALRSLGLNEENVPWWRVVNARGLLSINHGSGGLEKEVQAGLLRLEDIEVSPEHQIDLTRYAWRLSNSQGSDQLESEPSKIDRDQDEAFFAGDHLARKGKKSKDDDSKRESR